MEVKEIEAKDFEESIKEGKALVDCYATWCGPCKMMAPIIDEVAKEIDSVNFYKVDIDNAPEVADQYEIFSIPTLLLFENGELKNKSVGLKTKNEIMDFIK